MHCRLTGVATSVGTDTGVDRTPTGRGRKSLLKPMSPVCRLSVVMLYVPYIDDDDAVT